MFYPRKIPPERRHFLKHLFAFGNFALLVCNAAARLASGLARGLALAATAVLCALAQVTSLNGFDMLHDEYLQNIIYRLIL